jgi:hypothetical protein
LEKFNAVKDDLNFPSPTYFQVLRSYKNYETQRLILFAKILEGEITPFSNQSYILSESFDNFYRFDSIEIGCRKCEKVVKGEIAALSFIDRDTYPYFIRRAIGSQRHEYKRWQSVEEGVLSAKVKIVLFSKAKYQQGLQLDESWT